jgi:hypothetical protein
MPDEKLQKASELFEKFIVQKLKVSLKDVAIPVSKGGLGFFDLKYFISSMQCSWTKKALFNSIDCWRQDINAVTGMNTVMADPENFCQIQNPILHNIVGAFYDFKRCFNLINDNFM